MSELRRVPDKTPRLDAAEAQGGKVGLIARIVRPIRRFFNKRHIARTQAEIDQRHRDLVYRSEPPKHPRVGDADE